MAAPLCFPAPTQMIGNTLESGREHADRGNPVVGGGWHCVWRWALALLSFASARASDDGLWHGVQPRPHLAVGLSYDDNINASSTNQLAGFATTVAPGFGLVWGEEGQNHLALDYTFEWQQYFDQPEFDAENHRATLALALASPQTALQLTHKFARESIIVFEASRRVETQQNHTRLDLRRTLSEKTAWGLHYNQDFQDYDVPDLINSRQFVLGASLFYCILPKTDLLVEFNQGFTDLNQGADAISEQLNVGLTGSFTEKVRGTVKVGYEHREYTGALQPLDAVVTDVSLHAQFRERTAATLTVSYQPVAAVSQVSQTDETVQSLRVAVDLQQKLWHEQVTVRVGYSGQHDDYSVTGRADDYWGAQAGVSYSWKPWAETGLLYAHHDGSSSVGTRAFRRNLVTWTIAVHF